MTEPRQNRPLQPTLFCGFRAPVASHVANRAGVVPEVCYAGREGHDLRTIELDGEPWFHAKDVLDCLGLAVGRKGSEPYTRRLGPDEKRLVTPDQVRGLRGQGASFVSESGLYKLIMRSDKDTARPFQDWVTKVVLPSIRKTGGYLLNEAARETAHADTRSAMPVTR